MTLLDDRLPAPAAARLRRPGWRDPRLLVGLVLVALSVSLGSWAVTSAGRTTPVWAARGALTPGEAVDAAHLVVVDVRLAGAEGRYLPASEPLPADAVALAVVGDGELVPRSAVGEEGDLDVRSVAVPAATGLSERIRAGAAVDLWFVPGSAPGGLAAADDAAPQAPRALVEGVVVEQVDTAEGALVLGGGATLHVLVPTDRLADVLGALSADGEVAVVPGAGAP